VRSLGGVVTSADAAPRRRSATTLEEDPTMNDPGRAADPTPLLTGPVLDGAGQRRQVLALFGVALGIASSGVATLFAAPAAAAIGRTLFVGGLGCCVAAGLRYRASVRAGVSDVSRDGGLLACAALVGAGCLVLGGVANDRAAERREATRVPTGVGSCWHGPSGGLLRAVDCSAAHDWVATRVVDDPVRCDADAVGSVPTSDGRRLCLDRA
jgi:hypothetical protein